MKQRIWELDAFRGICILGMVIVHLLYDLNAAYQLQFPTLYTFVLRWGGVLFLVLSGICVTLGKHHLKRGLVVFACGLLVSAVTAGMYYLNFASKSLIIYFGVLHCLGTCMMLWALFRHFPLWVLAVIGTSFIAVGLYLNQTIYDVSPLLMPLGFRFPGFSSSDYFPLLPNLGYFLVGAAAGGWLYYNKKSLLPRVNTNRLPIRFLCSCGRHSLLMYLLHQPVLTGILSLYSLLG